MPGDGADVPLGVTNFRGGVQMIDKRKGAEMKPFVPDELWNERMRLMSAQPIEAIDAWTKAAKRVIELEGDLANERALYAEKQTELAAFEWISVADRLPNKGVRAIVLLNDNCVESDWIDLTGTWWFNVTDVTHWMPLPMPPVAKETK